MMSKLFILLWALLAAVSLGTASAWAAEDLPGGIAARLFDGQPAHSSASSRFLLARSEYQNILVICHRRVLFGVDDWGNKVYCTKCVGPFRIKLYVSPRDKCGGEEFTKTFRSEKSALSWKYRTCDCP